MGIINGQQVFPDQRVLIEIVENYQKVILKSFLQLKFVLSGRNHPFLRRLSNRLQKQASLT
jgi:hypothetical protein